MVRQLKYRQKNYEHVYQNSPVHLVDLIYYNNEQA